jgi:hypothetical protein
MKPEKPSPQRRRGRRGSQRAPLVLLPLQGPRRGPFVALGEGWGEGQRAEPTSRPKRSSLAPTLTLPQRGREPVPACGVLLTSASLPRRRRGRAAGSAPVRSREAQRSWPARASALRPLTCRHLFERSERSERSEFGDRATSASIAGNPRAARASTEALTAARPRLCSRLPSRGQGMRRSHASRDARCATDVMPWTSSTC